MLARGSGVTTVTTRVEQGAPDMPKYIVFFSYTSESMATMIAEPQDRAKAAEAVATAVGGKLEAFYWMFGEWDGFAIADVADDVSAAAISVAVSSYGGMSKIETHRLLDTDERIALLEKAGAVTSSGYTPPND